MRDGGAMMDASYSSQQPGHSPPRYEMPAFSSSDAHNAYADRGGGKYYKQWLERPSPQVREYGIVTTLNTINDSPQGKANRPGIAPYQRMQENRHAIGRTAVRGRSDLFEMEIDNSNSPRPDRNSPRPNHGRSMTDLTTYEGVQIGLTSEQVAHLVTWADEFEGRETLRFLLTTYRPPDAGPNPFAADAVWKPMMESLVKAGVRSIVDLGRLSAADVPAVKAEDMAKLLSDPRVVASRGKQEL